MIADTGEKDEPDRHIIVICPPLGAQSGEAGLDAVLDGEEPAEHIARREEVGQQVDTCGLFRRRIKGFFGRRGHD